jgi:aspartate/methionine/tyrosine aminotransferase
VEVGIQLELLVLYLLSLMRLTHLTRMPLRYALSPAVTGTAAPCIPQAKAWGAQYAAGTLPAGPLLDLSQGVPGEPPHASVLSALSKVAGDPEAAKYGAILGEPDMRAALATELRELYKLADADLKPEDVGITTGCNMAFLILLM